MRLLPLKLRQRLARGQAMVLACLSFLVLALMVTLSFNLSHALREKVSLQQHSDSLAYSMAVMEARALNYYAVSNRAIAASYVAMNSMHAYMAAASVTGEMMRASRFNFIMVGIEELGQCGCWTCIQHCFHALEAFQIAGDFGDAGRDYDDKVKELDTNFERANKDLAQLANAVHATQDAVHKKTVQAVTGGTASGLSELTEYNVPGASTLASSVGGLNAREFNCAVDGMECQDGPENSPKEALARVVTEISNASRPGWPARRAFGIPSLGMPIHLHPDFLQELMQDIPGEGINTPIPFLHKGTAKLVESRSGVTSGGQSSGNTGKTVAAEESGAMATQWKHGVWPYMSYDASVWSDSSGGGHRPDDAHEDEHEFDGVNTEDLMSCIEEGNCFMKFRADPDAENDHGQPRVYSYVTKQFRVGDPAKAPWELSRSAELNFTHGPQGTARMSLAAGEGAGLSKALVYYHRFGENGWREPPNLFNPYWRAKLHPFKPEEAQEVLNAAGNSDAAQLATVPGVTL